MTYKEAITSLKRKFGVRTDTELASVIGITQPTLSWWRTRGGSVSSNQLANLVWKAQKKGYARGYSQGYLPGYKEFVRPVLEYYPVEKVKTSHNKKWHIFQSKTERGKKIRIALEEAHGIYVFYNSQCEPIYVGKAKRTHLWWEINNAFNRKRDKQVVWKVSHPHTGSSFTPAYKKRRRILKQNVYLSDVASFLSVYEVSKRWVDTTEAILIRVCANELTNHRMETL